MRFKKVYGSIGASRKSQVLLVALQMQFLKKYEITDIINHAIREKEAI